MAQGLLALGVCCEQTFCRTSKRLVAPNSFQTIFVANFAKIWKKTFSCVLRDLAKILQILNCFGHICSKKRSGSEYGSFCRVWECQCPVGSGEGLFQSNFGILNSEFAILPKKGLRAPQKQSKLRI